MDSRFADVLFIRCEPELSYYCRLQGAIDKNMKAAEGDPELQCWVLNGTYTNMELMRGETNRTKAQEFEIR